MIDFLVNLFGYQFNVPEFVAGLVTGVVLVLILGRLSPIGEWIVQWSMAQRLKLSDRLRVASTDRYRMEILTRAQTQHMAEAIFALDEIAIQPRLLAPSMPIDPQSSEPLPENTLSVLPNLPDWTFLSGLYQAPTITLADSLANGANIMITGETGSGKSTALHYLTIRMINRDSEAGKAAELVPVPIHAADLQVGRRFEKDPLKPLIAAAQQTVSSGLASRLAGYLRIHFRQGTALLLLDGLDEMTSAELSPIAEWLQKLQEDYPGNRIVAAGPVRGYAGIAHTGLIPVPIAPWTEHDQRTFLTRWSQAWQQHIVPSLPKRRIGDLDPALLIGWLTGATRGATPLELTARVWAAFAGDVRGASTTKSLDAFLDRILSPDEQQAAEAAALSWINERQGALLERALRWGTPVDNLVEAGLLIRRAANHLSFTQPAIGAYLAAKAMVEAGLAESASQPGWAVAEAAMTYFAALGDVGEAAGRFVEESDEPLETNLLICARWLKDAPAKSPWRSQVLRKLATIASASERPYGLRLRAIHALAQVDEPSIGILFRRLLNSKNTSSRVLGALGLGGIQDEESIAALLAALGENRNLQVRQAVCLALAAIGTEAALEGLGNALLNGEEALRLAAAESLACNPDEGFNMLRDAIELDNLLTRRAAVFGLARVAEDWAIKILETVQLEDSQWVVRGAAAEAVERRRNPPWKILPLVKEISDLPWLVEFAAREGLGVAPGHAALEMLRRALNKGTLDEKLAAFEAIVWAAAEELGLEIHKALQSPEAQLRDAAYEALWRLDAAGVEVPAFVH